MPSKGKMKQKKSQRSKASVVKKIITDLIVPALPSIIAEIAKEKSYKDVSGSEDGSDGSEDGSDGSEDGSDGSEDDSDGSDGENATKLKKKLHRIATGNSKLSFEDLNLFYMNLPNLSNDTHAQLKRFQRKHRQWWNLWKEKIWHLYFGHPDDNSSAMRSEILKAQRQLLSKLAMILGVVKLANLFKTPENKDCFFFYRESPHLNTMNYEGLKDIFNNQKTPYKASYISALKVSFWNILKKMKTNLKGVDDTTLNFESNFCKMVAECHTKGQLNDDEEWKFESNTGFWSNILDSYADSKSKRKRNHAGTTSSNKKPKTTTTPAKSAPESSAKSAPKSSAKSAPKSSAKSAPESSAKSAPEASKRSGVTKKASVPARTGTPRPKKKQSLETQVSATPAATSTSVDAHVTPTRAGAAQRESWPEFIETASLQIQSNGEVEVAVHTAEDCGDEAENEPADKEQQENPTEPESLAKSAPESSAQVGPEVMENEDQWSFEHESSPFGSNEEGSNEEGSNEEGNDGGSNEEGSNEEGSNDGGSNEGNEEGANEKGANEEGSEDSSNHE